MALTIELGAAEIRPSRRPGSQEASPVTNTSVLKAERLRTILREATHRFNNELLDDEERQLLLDRIKRLRRQLGLS